MLTSGTQCDEVRPVCGNCYKRFPNAEEECEYDGTPSQSGRNSPGSVNRPPLGSPASSIGTAPGSNTSTSRSMELRLFHHFSTVTCLIMPTCEEPAGLSMWKVIIPSLAFECSYIYSAILGVAALHLLTLIPGDIALKAATYQYIDETVTAHREEMSTPDSSNPMNRFTTSMLLTVHAKLRSKYEANNGVPYTPPINYFALQNGAKDIWQQDLEMGSEVKAYINCYSHLAPHLEPYKPPEFHHHVYVNQDFPYDPLPMFVELETSIAPDRKSMYIQALQYISLIKQCILNGERPDWIQHRLAIVPSVLGKDFYILMQDGDPLSLMILARLFALLRFVDEPWWLQGTAEYEIRGLETLLPEEWKWGIEWPMEILENSLRIVGEEE